MLATSGPYIIRYPRGYGEGADWRAHEYSAIETGKGEKLLDGAEIALICAGPFSYRALEAAAEIKAETGKNPSIYNIRYIKPLDTALIDDVCASHSTIITVEDGTVMGGLHGAVAEYVSEHYPSVKVIPVGIPDRYIAQGTQEELREECGLTTEQIKAVIRKELKNFSKKD